MKIKQIIQELEIWAPPALQESYDNSGLITGNKEEECTGAIICLDSTEAVVQEAIDKGCNLIIAHHPIVFSGIKKLTGQNYVERTLLLAIRNNIAIYAIHTNLDHVQTGVNKEISDRLGLVNTRILKPKSNQLRKLITYVPHAHAETLSSDANPFVGEAGKRQLEPETRIELVAPVWLQDKISKALFEAHPYEEVAYDWTILENPLQTVGAGMLGELAEPIDSTNFIKHIKQVFGGVVRHTSITKSQIKTIALCGGSGSFLLPDAICANADIFISSDFKYHQFFDADQRIIIADIGHFENEQFTIPLIHRFLKEKFPKFAVHLTTILTNPIHYV